MTSQACQHKEPDRHVYADVVVGLMGETEQQLVTEAGATWFRDISVGAFRCIKCGHTGYYTGHWRAFYEQGVPCSGSDRTPRELPPFRATEAA